MLPNAKILFFFLLAMTNLESCKPTQTAEGDSSENTAITSPEKPELVLGAQQFEAYLPLLQGKKTAFMVNQTSKIGDRHLIDILLEKGVDIKAIFAPEHGFRGEADAGEKVLDGKDAKTGIPLISLYGSKKKPTPQELAGIDVIIFDIQDVGARFYTYISSMTYLMEAAAEAQKSFLVLDRPNPNGHFIDGPILDPAFSSFVGMHEIPVVHGMTVGEYAQMVNEEGWLRNGEKADLKVIPCLHYDHNVFYDLPVKPSPNLPNMRSIYLYPSLCFFEGTTFTAGRGTNMQFQLFGHPDYNAGSYEFTPVSRPGAKYPKHENILCKGEHFLEVDLEELQNNPGIDLDPILSAYQKFEDKDGFFIKNNFFDKLAGGESLKQQIIENKTEEEIKASWQAGLDQFQILRSKYLLYKDFN